MRWRSLPWDQAAYCALDLESSGLKPRRDEILSLAWVPVRGGVIRYGERFTTRVRPPNAPGLSQEGLSAHQLLPGELATAPPMAEVLPRLDAMLRGSVLILHHAPLDLAFLRTAYQRHGVPWPRPRVVDTVILLGRLERRRRWLEPEAPLPLALADARAHCGLPAYPSHDALSDALATAELFLLLRARLSVPTLRRLLTG
jgi:DNA polymerase-3 subunit epsilon